MAYEMYRRTGQRAEEALVAFVPDGRIVVNAASARILAAAGVRSVVMLWDAANHKVALKAAPKQDKNSFAISFVRDRQGGSIRAKSFTSHIGWSARERKLLPAFWNEKEKMLEITLPREYLKSNKSGDSKQRQ